MRTCGSLDASPPWLRAMLAAACVVAASAAAAGDVHRIGKQAYEKANCVGCHKWHGGGGGGYGGVALSLRDSRLDRETMRLVVRCGRPGTGMPYHDRKAYRGENRDCYASSKAELGDAAPPRAPRPLKAAEIDAVVDFVQARMQGRGVPSYEDCVAYWGADATRCRRMVE